MEPSKESTDIVDSHILDKHKTWLICPQCRAFPVIEPILLDAKFLIKIKCQCQSEPEVMTVKEYLELLKKKRTLGTFCDLKEDHFKYSAVTYCFNCDKFLCSFCVTYHRTLNPDHKLSDEEIHIDTKCRKHLKDNKIVAYCKDCVTNMCQTCLDEHDHLHKIVLFDTYFPKEVGQRKKEDFENAKSVDALKEQSKNEITDKVSSDSEIDKNYVALISKAFDDNKNINNDLGKLLEIMFENYFDTVEETPNYNIITNLKNISRFNCTKFEYDESKSLTENADEIIKYFTENYLIKLSQTPFELVKQNPYKGFGLLKICELPDGRFAASDWNNTLTFYNSSFEILNSKIYHFEPVTTMKLLANGTLATGSKDFNIIVWDLKTYEPKFNLIGHTGPVTKIIQLKDGTLVSSSWDHTIKLWKDDECIRTLEGHTDKVLDVTFLNNGQLGSCSFDGTIKLWNLSSFACEKTFTSPQKTKLRCLIQLEDGRLCASYSLEEKNGVKFIDLASLKEVGGIETEGIVLKTVQLEDQRLIIVTNNKTALVYRLEDNKLMFNLNDIIGGVGDVLQFSDGTIMAESAEKESFNILN